jgi:hypothetical protein
LDQDGGGAVFRRTSSLVVNPDAFTRLMNKWATAGASSNKRQPEKRSRQALGAASVASAAVALEDRTQAKKQPPAGQKEQGGGAAK